VHHFNTGSHLEHFAGYAPAATDRTAPAQSARQPEEQQYQMPDAEIGGGEVSFRSLPLWSLYSITSSAMASPPLSIPLHVGRGTEWVVHATGAIVARGARDEFA
jgi:hypothetical protein